MKPACYSQHLFVILSTQWVVKLVLMLDIEAGFWLVAELLDCYVQAFVICSGQTQVKIEHYLV